MTSLLAFLTRLLIWDDIMSTGLSRFNEPFNETVNTTLGKCNKCLMFRRLVALLGTHVTNALDKEARCSQVSTKSSQAIRKRLQLE